MNVDLCWICLDFFVSAHVLTLGNQTINQAAS